MLQCAESMQNKTWLINLCVVLMRVCSEVNLFQQPANGGRPHLFYLPTLIFTRIWREVSANFGPWESCVI